MAIGATKPPRRQAFDPSKNYDDPPPQSDERPSKRCVVHGCELPGSLNMGSGWCCCYHANANAADWPAITDVLRQEQHLITEINIGRNLKNQSDYHAVRAGHISAIDRLVGQITQPQLDFLRARNDQTYERFIYSLEMLVGGAVSKVLTAPREKTVGRPRQVVKTPAELLAERFA